MGGSSKTPKPPVIEPPPPPVEDISAAYSAPTMRQEMARRQKRGAFATKGQTLGASGEVLGAGVKELAPVTAGFDLKEKEKSLEEFTKDTPVLTKGNYVKGRRTNQKVDKKKTMVSYKKYLKELKKQQSEKTFTRGQSI